MKLKQIIESGKVVYVEGDVNYSFIHMVDGSKFCIPLCLKALKERLPGRYLRIHKSYMINELYLRIISIDTNKVVMHKGLIIPVSRRQMINLKRNKNVTKFIRSQKDQKQPNMARQSTSGAVKVVPILQDLR